MSITSHRICHHKLRTLMIHFGNDYTWTKRNQNHLCFALLLKSDMFICSETARLPRNRSSRVIFGSRTRCCRPLFYQIIEQFFWRQDWPQDVNCCLINSVGLSLAIRTFYTFISTTTNYFIYCIFHLIDPNTFLSSLTRSLNWGYVTIISRRPRLDMQFSRLTVSI